MFIVLNRKSLAEGNNPNQATDLKILERLKKIPPLQHSRGDRWPLIIWCSNEDMKGEEAYWQMWIDRGISPLSLKQSSKVEHLKVLLPTLQYFHSKNVPIIVLLQGLLHDAYAESGSGYEYELLTGGSNHLPPAEPQKTNNDFTCPAWMYDNPKLKTHTTLTLEACQLLKESGIQPTSVLVDFESGTYLRNGAEDLGRVKLAMEEAWECPRCIKRFGKEAMDSVEKYSVWIRRGLM